MSKLLSWLLGLSDVKSIGRVEPGFAASWANTHRFWLVVSFVLIVAGGIAFYLRFESRGSRRLRIALGAARGLLLSCLLLTLASPVLRIVLIRKHPPTVAIVFDGTASMAIRDVFSQGTQRQIEQAVGWKAVAGQADHNVRLQRQDYLKSWLGKAQNPLRQISRTRGIRFQAFLFEGEQLTRLKRLETPSSEEAGLDTGRLAEQLSSRGQLTAIGDAISQLSRQTGSDRFAAVVLFSDFAQNSGPSVIRSQGSNRSIAMALQVPVHTVGLGADVAHDLTIDLLPPPRMKRAERSTIRVKVAHSNLDGQETVVRLSSDKLGRDFDVDKEIEARTIRLDSPVQYVEFSFTPRESGRIQLVATAEPLDGEVTQENNMANRQVDVIDDFLRLMYVAHEPNWEWRFVKEVFHRDKLVGMRGFRTYLRSSDPSVRAGNSLFLPSLTPARSEFFSTDVIVLGDMPRSGLSNRFCKMTKEFVSRFGGGLVIASGPRFGPRELLNTHLAEMLPIVVGRNASRRQAEPFAPRVSAQGYETDFMQLGESDAENRKAWSNLSGIDWYQPAARLHPLATSLLEHPVDTCNDGETAQPLMAIRRFGKGEVVYLAFDELWRLRRRYGERYYRQLWSQMINRLGLSHALGSQKRFAVRPDRRQYQLDDNVVVTVEAYDGNFEPLSGTALPDQVIQAQWYPPGSSADAQTPRPVELSEVRPGEFSGAFRVQSAGEYRLRVLDPIEADWEETSIQVADRSVEMRTTERDIQLQTAIAESTGGKSYDLLTVDSLIDDLVLDEQREEVVRVKEIWSTPLWFTLVVGLMLGEWSIRKWLSMT